MSFTNLYYKRAVATPKACYVCHKPTCSVLATINTVDFIYTCDNHLTDPGFATQVGESTDGVSGARKLGLSPEEIAKVKEEWEDRQRRKKDNEKDKDKSTKDSHEKGKEKDGSGKQDDKPEKSKDTTPPTVAAPSTMPTAPVHERYTLHRDMFALRLADHRRRRQTTQAKELAPRLPGAPRGGPA